MGYQGDPGWVYAVREEGTPLVKIGYTRYAKPEYRLMGLRHQFHVSLTLVGAVWIAAGVHCMEHALHMQLASQCIEKEWFYLYMNQVILQGLVDKLLPDVERQVAEHEAERVRVRKPCRQEAS